MKSLFSAFICFLSLSVLAAEPTTSQKIEETAKETTQKIEETAEKVAEESALTRARRNNSNYFVLGNYSPFDLLIPSKYGITLGVVQDRDRTWEFEYMKGSVSVPFIVEDLGSMTDERFSIIKRSYFANNSFNLNYGVTYFDFSIHLGNNLLSRVPGSPSSIDLVELQGLGANIGLGNRWSFDHGITVGVDWISWAQPLIITNRKSAFLDYANNAKDKDDVDTAMKVISYFPRLTFLKVQLGILF